MDELKTSVLYFGDNLEILRKYIPDNSIDLIYLDPPFSSNKSYNILFKESDRWSEAQIKAFDDTWHWTPVTENAYREFLLAAPLELGKLIEGMVDGPEGGGGWIGRNDVTAYLVMMAPRLREMHRVLKDAGSLYLHCDPTASHYLKLVLDQIFKPTNFRNEIVWCYSGPARAVSDFPDKHDIIFRYSKSGKVTFNPDSIRIPYSESFISRRRYAEGKGGIYRGRIRSQEETEAYKRGKVPEDWWNDIPSGGQLSRKERLGYPTQKPLALLERIINASSNEGDIVLDPFCGCGTALVAAHKLNRRWIGIDTSALAINLSRNRLQDSFDIRADVIGERVALAASRGYLSRGYCRF